MGYKIVAVDLDGTITEDGPWPGNGKFYCVRAGCAEELRLLREMGYRITIWTTRGKDIGAAENFLRINNIPFDFVNQNPPDVPENLSKQKIIADAYIDDRSVPPFDGQWLGMAEAIHSTIQHREKLKASSHGKLWKPEPKKQKEKLPEAVAKYYSILESLPEPDERSHYAAFGELYEKMWDRSSAASLFLQQRFITPVVARKLTEDIRSMTRFIPEKARTLAEDIFISKNTARGNLWADVGAIGALIEIHGKMTRLANPSSFDGDELEDAAADFFNYCVIFLMAWYGGFLRPGDNKRTPQQVIITGTHAGGLGEYLQDTFRANGFEVHSINPSKEAMATWNNEKMLAVAHEYMDAAAESIEEFGLGHPWLINNFGINRLAWVEDIDKEHLNVLDANLKWPIAISSAFFHKFGKHSGMRVLNISSQTYRVAQRTTTVYCASKAGLSHFTKVLNREVAPAGVVVNALAPGLITDTMMSEKTSQQVLEMRGWKNKGADQYAKSLIPLNRYTDREEVALAALEIMHLPSYICGTTIDMTGGQ